MFLDIYMKQIIQTITHCRLLFRKSGQVTGGPKQACWHSTEHIMWFKTGPGNIVGVKENHFILHVIYENYLILHGVKEQRSQQNYNSIWRKNQAAIFVDVSKKKMVCLQCRPTTSHN